MDMLDRLAEQDEENANTWSKNKLIPPEEFQIFKNREIFTKASVENFARSIGIAPGIVVGRLQKEDYILHSMFNELKEHYIIG